MILLTDRIISKIERLRRFHRISAFSRSVFLVGMMSFSFFALYTEQYSYYSYMIICMLISTFLINLLSDTFNSDLEEILKIIEYQRCKNTHENV